MILPQPISPGETMNLGVARSIDEQSNILSLPSDATEDFISFSDIPIGKVTAELSNKDNVLEANHCSGNADNELMNNTEIKRIEDQSEITVQIDPLKETDNQSLSDLESIEGSETKVNLATKFKKPRGSAYIHVRMKLGDSNQIVPAYVCVDTGADLTLCDSTYLVTHFGKNVLKYVTPMSKTPKLRSASGHFLKILGQVSLSLFLGEYELAVKVVTYEGSSGMFLLGNDSFYGRLIYDRGLFLGFADKEYPPIPIHYELSRNKVKAVERYQIAPRSSAVIQVKVTDGTQLTGKEILLTPLEECEDNLKCHNCESTKSNFAFDNVVPVRNTVSVINSKGCSPLLVQNNTDDILTITPDADIARVSLISASDSEDGQVNFVIDNDPTILKQNSQWPISALQGEFKDTLPDNVIIQWDRIRDPVKDCDQDNIQENVNFVHDKEERRHLLDGTGEGFPTPSAAQTEPPLIELDSSPEAWLENVDRKHLSDQEWIKLKTVLERNSAAFSKSKTEIGCCRYFKVDLPLKPGTGYLYNKPRPLPFKHREKAAETISELLAKGVIRLSKSPHATNVVVVGKKTVHGVSGHRLCVDLRQVNEHSVPNRYPNPSIDHTMENFEGAALCTTYDFKDAFHMMVLTDSSIPVTAFYFDNVLYEYVRVPFGHVCAMNAFCSLMALLCVGYDSASYYADDLMITTKRDSSKSKDQIFDLHLEHVEGMLVRIIEAGLMLVAHKSQWCYPPDKPMDWLGFTMQNNLLRPQETKVAAIKDFPTPSTAKQVVSFVSTASFYRRFIKSFAKEVQPMYTVANTEPFVWTPEAQIAFDKVKEIMCSDLVLRLPRQGEPFQIYSDASAGAIGVVLCQIDPIDKLSHPCAYGSRKFNDCEMKLSIPCKELLAIVYGLNLWSFYICGNPVQVFSDCRAWTFLKVQCGASGKISRLALLVQEYDITISYVKGTANKAADGLSRAWDDGLTKFDDQITARHPALNKLGAPELSSGEALKLEDYLEKCDEYVASHWPKILKEYEDQQPPQGSVKSLKLSKSNKANKQKLDNYEKDTLNEAKYVNSVIQEAAILHIDRQSAALRLKPFVDDGIYPFLSNKDLTTEISDSDSEAGKSDPEDNDDSEDELADTTNSSVRTARYNIRLITINESCFTLTAFADLQGQDEFCSGKIDLCKKKDSRTNGAGFFMKKGILMRSMHTKDQQTYNVICVPQVLVKPLLESTHKSLLSGHFGSQRYFLDMSRRYYWPKMKDDIIDYQHHCLPCQYNDKFPVKYLSGHVIRPLWPMHVIHCDLVVGLPRALDGSYAILLLYDGFSRFTFGIPLGSEKADYVVNKLMSHFVAAFGLPWALHSDNGRNIDGALIRHLSKMLGVIKTSTPPHTPNANPTETMCGAVSMLLRKGLNESDQRYWSLCLPFILNALNSTVHTATGYTPNSLFFGRFQERDPVPLIPFDSETANVNEYFQKMRRFQELSFQIVRSRNERKLLAKKVHWDTTARTHPYKEGDFVLVKNNNPASGPGKKKLRSRYLGPFRVLKAYTSSLIVIPWTENDRLDEYNKSPDAFRLIHRGDIKPFHTRQVSVKHCKPYHGSKETEHIIDPIMLTRFLDSLGIDSHDEVLSEIDHSPKSEVSTDTWSTERSVDSGDSGSNPPPPEFNARKGNKPNNGARPKSDSSGFSDPGPDNGPDHVEQPPDVEEDDQPQADNQADAEADEAEAEEQVNQDEFFEDIHEIPNPEYNENLRANDLLLNDLDIPQATKDALKKYYRYRDTLDNITKNAKHYRQRVDELELLVRNPDPEIRERAEFELANTLDRMELDLKRAEREGETQELESSSSEHNSSSTKNTTLSGSRELDQEDQLYDMPDLEWDEEQPPVGNTPGPIAQDIHIKMPNLEVTISPTRTGASQVTPPRTSPPMSSKKRKQVEDWLSNASIDPNMEQDLLSGAAKTSTPAVARTTKSGRIMRKPARYPANFGDFVEYKDSTANSFGEAMGMSRSRQREQSMAEGLNPQPTGSKSDKKTERSSRENKAPKSQSSKVKSSRKTMRE